MKKLFAVASPTVIMLLGGVFAACVPSPKHGRGRSAVADVSETKALRPFTPQDKGQSIAIDLSTLAQLGFEGSVELLESLVAMGADYVVVLDVASGTGGGDDAEAMKLRQAIHLASPELGAASNAVVLHSVPEQDGMVGVTMFPRDYFPFFRAGPDRAVSPVLFRYDGAAAGSKSGSIVLRETSLQRAGVAKSTARTETGFEGGNFQSDGKGNCFVSSGGLRGTYVGPSNPQLEKELKEKLGCREVTILRGLAHEDGEIVYLGTNHLDMWAKILDAKTAIVAEVSPEMRASYALDKQKYVDGLQRTFEFMNVETYDAYLNDIESILDENAKTLNAKGYKVVRIPIPMPGTVLSANLNGVQIGKNLLFPRFAPSDLNGGLFAPALFEKLHADTIALLKAEGFEAKWIDYSRLQNSDGSLHCMTSNVPSSIVESFLLGSTAR